MSITSRAMLASVKIQAWTGRKLDREATHNVTTEAGAEEDAARVNKLLIPAEAMAAVGKAEKAARATHLAMTLPWADAGARVLPVKSYFTYTAKMGEHRTAYDAAVSAFLSAYPGYVDAAEKRMGKLFKAEDYPTVSDLRRRYAFDFGMMPIPDSDDFRIALDADAVEAIKADTAARIEEATKGAMRDAWERVADVCKRMVNRLQAYKPAHGEAKAEGVFRDSLVTNVRELAELLPAFNLTNDPEMTRIAERMLSELSAHDAAELRTSEKLRKSVAASAESILADISDFLA